MSAITRLFVGPKDPDEVIDYAVNFFDRWVSGDAIDSVAWTIPSPLTNEDQPAPTVDLAAGQVICPVFVGGGVHGKNYELRCRVVTTGGRTLDQTITLEVRNR